MNPPAQPYTLDRVVRMVLTALGAILLFFLLRYLSDVLIPFAVAAVLAYLLNPLVTVFERKTRHRGAAVALALFGIVLLLAAGVVIAVPLIGRQVDRFERSLKQLRADLAASSAAKAAEQLGPESRRAGTEGLTAKGLTAEGLRAEALTAQGLAADGPRPADAAPVDTELNDEAAAKSGLGWTELVHGWERYRGEAEIKPRRQRLAELRSAIAGTFIGSLVEDGLAFTETERFRELAVNALQSLAVGGLTVVSFFFNFVVGLIGLVIVLVYLVFLLLDYPQYSRSWPGLVPPQYRVQVVDFYTQFNLVLRRYFRGQAVVALITGLMLAAGFTLMGLPMAAPFGLFVGLLAMVPYLTAVAVVPGLMLAALRAVESDASLLMSVVLTLAVFGIVQVIQDTLVTPRVMGQATGLRPVTILLGLFIWGKLLGFLGLILAIPLTCLAIAYYRKYVLKQADSAA